MDKLLATVGFAGAFVLLLIFSPLAGALIGWVVGLFFGNAILGTFASFGITGLSMWKLGATLGFVGAFFKTTVTTGNK